jgi:hypothetical protein
MKMEAIFSFVISVDFQRTTQRYIPEDRTLKVNLIYELVTPIVQLLLPISLDPETFVLPCCMTGDEGWVESQSFQHGVTHFPSA